MARSTHGSRGLLACNLTHDTSGGWILHLERLWSHNIAITTRLVNTVTTPMLLKTVQAQKIDPNLLIAHRFMLEQIPDAYETFGQAARTRALKVIIEA